MNRLAISGVIAAAAVVLAGCAATASRVRVDRAETDVANCRSFDWLPASSDAASFTEQRVRGEVMSQLQAKGYAIAAENPDCRITYVLSSYERPKRKPSVGVGAGGGSRGVAGGIGVSLPIGRKDEHVGTFTLDVIDAAKKAQIWSGSLEAAFSGPELTPEEARSVVAKILAELPDRAAAAS